MQIEIRRLLRRDGVVTRARLVRAGMSDRRIRAAVAHGDLLRLRQGVFAAPDSDPLITAAVTAGGRAACVTELQRLGVWVRSGGAPHVHLPAHGSRPRSRGPAVLHWSELLRTPSVTSVSPLDAVVQASRCLAHPELVAAVDSALRRGVVRRDEVAGIRPALDRALIDADPSAESGLESLTRLAIRDLGLHVEPQASIVGVGSVDLLVEGCVIVELDGATHRTPQQQRRDHDRDAVAMASGYTPLRFDYVQVIGRRALVARAVVNAVRTHRSVKSPGRVVRVAQMRLDATTRT